MTGINQSSLRIALLSYRSNPHCGGQGVYIQSLSRALSDLGHKIDIISGPPYPTLDSDIKLIKLPSLDLYNPNDLFRVPKVFELMDSTNLIEWLGVSTMGFSEPLTFGMRAYKYLKNKFHKYDIIHDNQSLSFGLWAIKKKIPTIATIHHPITVDLDIAVKSEPVLWKKLKLLRWYSFLGMQKKVAKTLPHIITVSESAQNDISKEFRIPKNRFTVISNGINTDRFYPMPEIKRRENRIIVTNSADTPLKGLYYLLLSVAEISKKKKMQLIVIGTPKKNGKILRQIKKLGIGSFVTFTGRVSDEEFVQQYAKATVAVIPSVYEGFGLPAGEAMACGVPVISTTGGALPEVVGDAAILVPPADPAALTKAITKVLDSPNLAARLSNAGYQRVQNHLTWHAAAQKTVDAYRRAIHDYYKI